MTWFEIIGIAGTIFVLISFLMKDIKLVRIINIVGAVLFVIYGALIGALSTWLLNGILIIIHIVYLIKGSKEKKNDIEAEEQRKS